MTQPYIDISPEISASTAVFPGDAPFCREVTQDFPRGDNLLLSKIETTVHIGAHADAPNHYRHDGQGIAERSLIPYYGPCQVVHVHAPRGQRIAPEHLQGKRITAPRILLRTDSYPDPQRWNSDFNALSPELVRMLAEHNVVLVGIDTPSVDLADAKQLIAHAEIYRHDMSILEGLVLHDVAEGTYHLTALPLRLRDADASPVRAVLWKN